MVKLEKNLFRQRLTSLLTEVAHKKQSIVQDNLFLPRVRRLIMHAVFYSDALTQRISTVLPFITSLSKTVVSIHDGGQGPPFCMWTACYVALLLLLFQINESQHQRFLGHDHDGCQVPDGSSMESFGRKTCDFHGVEELAYPAEPEVLI